MQYWHIQLHPGNMDAFPVERIKEILKKKEVIGMGVWKEGESQIDNFQNELSIGDIVLVRSGQTPIALVEVIGEYEYTDDVNENLDWFQNRRKIKILGFFDDDEEAKNILAVNKKIKAPGTFSKSESGATNDFIVDWHNKIKKEMAMLEEETAMNDKVELLKYKKQIILQGPPGTGKTRLAKEMAEKLIEKDGVCELIQFHPAYSYEDFVRGIIAETKDGNVSYRVENKIFARLAQEANDNKDKNYVLIIDEINRANLAAVFGELIYASEYRGEKVASLYEHEKTRDIIIPENLFIIGTMNTADRSVGHIDYAIRRRFAFVDVPPDRNVIKNGKASELFNKVEKLFSEDYLSPDFNKDDVMIGHSYFLAEDDDQLKIKLNYEIKPILREYLKDGILLENARDAISGLPDPIE